MSATPSQLIASAPVLRVRNVVAAANHYRDAMGFGYDRFYGEPPVFVIVGRDDMYLMLKQVADAGSINPHGAVGVASCDVYFWTSGVDALHEEFVRRGAKVTDGLSLQEYGCKEFAVEDIDGYEIRFGQIVAEDRAA
jgi:uncharacterized glyoxalase superfamily protein PhnB